MSSANDPLPASSITYAIEPEDLDAVRDTVGTRYGTNRKMLAPLGWALIVLGIAGVLANLFLPHRHGFSMSGYVNGPVQIILGVAYLLRASKPRFLIVRRPRRGVLTTLSWDARGIAIGAAGRASQTTTWPGIRRLEISATILQLHRSFAPPIVVPRRAFSDDGSAFVSFVEDRIIGKQLLVRATPVVVHRSPPSPGRLTDPYG